MQTASEEPDLHKIDQVTEVGYFSILDSDIKASENQIRKNYLKKSG